MGVTRQPLKRSNLGMDTQGKLGKDAGSVAYSVRVLAD
jgi:hypothetical protein